MTFSGITLAKTLLAPVAAAMSLLGPMASVTAQEGYTQMYVPPAKYIAMENSREYDIEVVSQKRINSICSFDAAIAKLTNTFVAGCYDGSKDKIYILRGIYGTLLKDTLRHEKAHANGWRH